MEINTEITTKSGTFKVVYREDPSLLLNDEGVYNKVVHVFGFHDGKLILVNDGSGAWTPIGGHVEAGESYEVAAIREAQEESNMKVLTLEFIGVQDVHEESGICRQARFFCITEPYGPFVSDPDGDIVEIKLIDPADYKKYFDWKIVGEHLMSRVIELLNASQKK